VFVVQREWASWASHSCRAWTALARGLTISRRPEGAGGPALCAGPARSSAPGLLNIDDDGILPSPESRPLSHSRLVYADVCSSGLVLTRKRAARRIRQRRLRLRRAWSTPRGTAGGAHPESEAVIDERFADLDRSFDAARRPRGVGEIVERCRTASTAQFCVCERPRRPRPGPRDVRARVREVDSFEGGSALGTGSTRSRHQVRGEMRSARAEAPRPLSLDKVARSPGGPGGPSGAGETRLHEKQCARLRSSSAARTRAPRGLVLASSGPVVRGDRGDRRLPRHRALAAVRARAELAAMPEARDGLPRGPATLAGRARRAAGASDSSDSPSTPRLRGAPRSSVRCLAAGDVPAMPNPRPLRDFRDARHDRLPRDACGAPARAGLLSPRRPVSSCHHLSQKHGATRTGGGPASSRRVRRPPRRRRAAGGSRRRRRFDEKRRETPVEIAEEDTSDDARRQDRRVEARRRGAKKAESPSGGGAAGEADAAKAPAPRWRAGQPAADPERAAANELAKIPGRRDHGARAKLPSHVSSATRRRQRFAAELGRADELREKRPGETEAARAGGGGGRARQGVGEKQSRDFTPRPRLRRFDELRRAEETEETRAACLPTPRPPATGRGASAREGAGRGGDLCGRGFRPLRSCSRRGARRPEIKPQKASWRSPRKPPHACQPRRSPPGCTACDVAALPGSRAPPVTKPRASGPGSRHQSRRPGVS